MQCQIFYAHIFYTIKKSAFMRNLWCLSKTISRILSFVAMLLRINSLFWGHVVAEWMIICLPIRLLSGSSELLLILHLIQKNLESIKLIRTLAGCFCIKFIPKRWRTLFLHTGKDFAPPEGGIPLWRDRFSRT